MMLPIFYDLLMSFKEWCLIGSLATVQGWQMPNGIRMYWPTIKIVLACDAQYVEAHHNYWNGIQKNYEVTKVHEFDAPAFRSAPDYFKLSLKQIAAIQRVHRYFVYLCTVEIMWFLSFLGLIIALVIITLTSRCPKLNITLSSLFPIHNCAFHFDLIIQFKFHG